MQAVDDATIAVVGLGYVGLPLATAFGRQFDVTGFDIDLARVAELRDGRDRTGETTPADLASAARVTFTSDPSSLRACNVFVITVPTPIDEHKRPDFTPLVEASRSVGAALEPGDVVIYESTVYPGATEEICVPELARASGLQFNVDFFVGYSPERINPGDTQHRLTSVPRITSGSTPETADFVDALYRRIVTAGTHKVSAIMVAEAAKVIENTQRDANIALVNEFALIFHRLGIDTTEVLEAAGTKWNFLPFRPGLVGGHCIGVDPYYLIQKAQVMGYFPDILLACRRINDAMGQHVASEVVKLMIAKGHVVRDSRVLVLGFTFKENCPDLRNTRVMDLINELKGFGVHVDIFDPWADAAEARAAYGVDLLAEWPEPDTHDAVVVAVAHEQFKADDGSRVRALAGDHTVVYDIKGMLPVQDVDGRL